MAAALTAPSGPVALAPAFRLTHTAVNSFKGSADNDPSYIMGLASPAAAAAAVAVAGSERELKLYDRATLQCTRTVAAPAHADRVNEVSFAPPRSAAAGLLFSASSDGAVRAWDCGGGGGGGAAPSLELRGGREEVWSVSVSDGPLVAAGTQAAPRLTEIAPRSPRD